MNEATSDEKPSVEVQRRMVENKRDQLRTAAFESILEIASMSAQMVLPEQESEKKKMLSDLRMKRDNSYAAAKEMTRLLSEFPEPAHEPES